MKIKYTIKEQPVYTRVDSTEVQDFVRKYFNDLKYSEKYKEQISMIFAKKFVNGYAAVYFKANYISLNTPIYNKKVIPPFTLSQLSKALKQVYEDKI